MNIGLPPIAPSPASMSTPNPSLGESQRTFGAILAVDRRSRAAAPEAGKEREAAEQLVAVTFIEPILRQAREVRSEEGPFGITQAEKQFGGMLDAATAKSMVRSWNFPLVDRLARDMRAAMGKQEAP
jgi:hypothetical protein